MFANAFVLRSDLLWLSAFGYYTVLLSELTLVDVPSTVTTTFISDLASGAVFKADILRTICVCMCVCVHVHVYVSERVSE